MILQNALCCRLAGRTPIRNRRMKALLFISAVALLSGLCYLIHKDIIIGAASVFVSVAAVFRFLDKFNFK